MRINKECVCVKVKRKGNKLIVLPGIYVLKAGTDVAPVNLPVVDKEGNVIEATGRFMMTTETINPYHFVCQLN